MPIFDFKCNECEKEFERLTKSSEKTPECPLCGSLNTQRKEVQKFGFEMHGIGVYKNNTH